MAKLGLEKEIVDTGVYERTVARFREAKIVLPTFAELADPTTIAPAVRSSLAGVDPDAASPKNLFRVHWWNDDSRREHRERPGLRRAPELAHRRPGEDPRRPRRPLPDDRGAQGPRGVRVPRSADRDGAVRSDGAPSDLAVDRELLPRRRRHLAHPRLPRRRGAPGGDEPRALRVAGEVVPRPRGHRPHAGDREQREGDLRRVRPDRPRSEEHRLQPVLRVRQLPRPPPRHGARPRGGLPRRAREAPAALARRVHVGDGIRGDARGGRLAQGAARRAHRRRRSDSSARRSSTTATASTTSRGSATSTSRTSTTR